MNTKKISIWCKGVKEPFTFVWEPKTDLETMNVLYYEWEEWWREVIYYFRKDNIVCVRESSFKLN